MTKSFKKIRIQKRGIRLKAIKELKKCIGKGKKEKILKRKMPLSKAEKIISDILGRKETREYCAHFLVGSSSAFTFL